VNREAKGNWNVNQNSTHTRCAAAFLLCILSGCDDSDPSQARDDQDAATGGNSAIGGSSTVGAPGKADGGMVDAAPMPSPDAGPVCAAPCILALTQPCAPPATDTCTEQVQQGNQIRRCFSSGTTFQRSGNGIAREGDSLMFVIRRKDGGTCYTATADRDGIIYRDGNGPGNPYRPDRHHTQQQRSSNPISIFHTHAVISVANGVAGESSAKLTQSASKRWYRSISASVT